MNESSLAVKALIANDNLQVLIVRRRPNDIHSPNVWELPGGRLRPGEDPSEGLKRETKEETGILIEVLSPLAVHRFTRDDGQKIKMVVFLCKPVTTDVKLSMEHTDFDWIQLGRATEKLDANFQQEIGIWKRLATDLR